MKRLVIGDWRVPLEEQMTLTRCKHLVITLTRWPSMELGGGVSPVVDDSKQGGWDLRRFFFFFFVVVLLV